MVTRYNQSDHRATGKAPFILFFNRDYLANPAESLLDEESDAGDSSNSENEYASFHFGDSVEDSTDSESDSPSNENDATHPFPSVLTAEDLAAVKRHTDKYLANIEKDASVHYRSSQVSVADTVLLVKDFDNNPDTRRRKFEGNYEDYAFEVVSHRDDGFVEIRHPQTSEVQIVHRKRLRKVNVCQQY